jgi:hypothetical protein
MIELSLESLTTVTGGAGDGSFPVHLKSGIPMAGTNGGTSPTDFSCKSTGANSLSCVDKSGMNWDIPKSMAK